jgi:hypothetical protein
MKKVLLFIAVSVIAVSANASTKYVECEQPTDKGDVLIIKATIDDESDQAEVQLYATSAACAKSQTCGTDVYKKEVLPTVLRLTWDLQAGSILHHKTVIDIDRTTLHVVTRLTLYTQKETIKSTYTGTCKVRVETTKKRL